MYFTWALNMCCSEDFLITLNKKSVRMREAVSNSKKGRQDHLKHERTKIKWKQKRRRLSCAWARFWGQGAQCYTCRTTVDKCEEAHTLENISFWWWHCTKSWWHSHNDCSTFDNDHLIWLGRHTLAWAVQRPVNVSTGHDLACREDKGIILRRTIKRTSQLTGNCSNWTNSNSETEKVYAFFHLYSLKYQLKWKHLYTFLLSVLIDCFASIRTTVWARGQVEGNVGKTTSTVVREKSDTCSGDKGK